jgi:signal recognition particle receptor subunit beta
MHFFLSSFKDFINSTKVVVGVTRMDLSFAPRIDDYHKELEKTGLKIPVFEVDARHRQDVSMLLEALLYSLDPGMAA